MKAVKMSLRWKFTVPHRGKSITWTLFLHVGSLYYFECKKKKTVKGSCASAWSEELRMWCSAKKKNSVEILHVIVERSPDPPGTSLKFWPHCKSISAILLMNWSMIYTVTGVRFRLLLALMKCWQWLFIFSSVLCVIASKLICIFLLS